MGLGTSKLNKRAKNEAKNRENLKNLQRAPLSLFEAEILHNIITFIIEYACKISANFNDTFGKLGVFDVESPTREFSNWDLKELEHNEEKYLSFITITHKWMLRKI